MSNFEDHNNFTYNSCNDSTLKCNYIKPFHSSVYNKINTRTNKRYTEDEIKIIKKTFNSICNSKGGNSGMCCSKTFNSQNKITMNYIKKFNQKYSKHRINYKDKVNNVIENIELLKKDAVSSENNNKNNNDKTNNNQNNNNKNDKNNNKNDKNDDKYSSQNGWDSSPIDGYLICKIGTSVEPSNDPNVLVAKNIIQDCFSNNCDNTERMTIENIMNLSTNNEKFAYMDDLKVYEAVKENNIEYIKSYLRKRNDTDMPLTNDDKNNRLIHLAVQYSKISLVQLLVQLDADLDLQNYQGDTALHIAVLNNNFRIVETLLKSGAQLNIKNNKGETVAFKAVATDDINMLVYIYNKGGNLFEKNNKGDNLIHHAIKHCSNKYLMVSYLADKGVPLNKNNKTYNLIQSEIKKLRKNENNMNNYFNSNSLRNSNYNLNNDGVKEVDKDSLTVEEKEYLSILSLIQKKTFTKKYGNKVHTFKKDNNMVKYLDKTCVAAANTIAVIQGNESEEECLAKGGTIGNIIPSTYTTIQYYKDGESYIEAIDEEDLYYTKEGKNKNIPELTQEIEPEGYLRDELLVNKSINSEVPEDNNASGNASGDASGNASDDTNGNSSSNTNGNASDDTSGNSSSNTNGTADKNKEKHPNLQSDNSPEVEKFAALAKENFKNIKNKINYRNSKQISKFIGEPFTNYNNYRDPDNEKSVDEGPIKYCARLHPAVLITIVFVILLLVVYFYILN